MSQSPSVERRIVGLGVSRGFAIGPLFVLRSSSDSVSPTRIPVQDGKAEVGRLRCAVESAKVSLQRLALAEIGSNNAVPNLIEVHRLMLDSLEASTASIILEQSVNAEWALQSVLSAQIQRLLETSDPQFRDKYVDIQDSADRIHQALTGEGGEIEIDPGSVIYASDLRPSVAIDLLRSGPAGFITERGGWTSHTSILAREFQVPMVTGVRLWGINLDKGDVALVDGSAGEVVLQPHVSTYAQVAEVDRLTSVNPVSLTEASRAITKDGIDIKVMANSATASAYQLAKSAGAEGIGLYRSELLINRSGIIPNESEQLAAYRDIGKSVGNDGVKVRTFELDSDVVPVLSRPERNPALGLRSIRTSLRDTSVFRTQIRALLRASAEYEIDIILPMISRMDEVHSARMIIEEERGSLVRLGLAVGSPQIGCMIEVPAAVFIADKIAAAVDFLCLGTNDLVQYLLAVDRDNGLVAENYETLHPAVFGAIRRVVEAGAGAKLNTILCGEMAGSPFYTPLLIGLGVRTLSVNNNSVPSVRKLIAGITLGEASSLVDSLEGANTAAEIESIVRSFYLNYWSDLFPDGLLDTPHR